MRAGAKPGTGNSGELYNFPAITARRPKAWHKLADMSDSIDRNKLVDALRCIDAIFHKEARPGLRTWMDWKAKGYLPFVRVGRRVFYDPADCRTALEKRFTIRAR